MKDRPTVRGSINAILQGDFNRILVGQVAAIETGGRPAVREAFAILPEAWSTASLQTSPTASSKT